MNPFAQLLNDTVFIVSNDGTRTGPYKTAISSKNGFSASIFESKLDVEEGWKLFRPLPSGREESYKITEANYSPGLHAIPPHWTLKLRKDGSLAKENTASKATTININNSQGIQIGDHNVQHIANSLAGLVEEIESSASQQHEKEEAKGLLHTLLSNPTVAGILGGATSGLLALLS
ncbi:MAG: hypothetical protein NTY00_05805 [Deltaproteobacteria bacterium]|nr:hypothetical protein [Deltaproteobacteria bacterium]